MNCAECGQQLPEGARFCTACGRRVEPVLVCAQCQTQAPEGAKFCFNCGSALGKTAPAAAAPAPKPAPRPAAPPAAVKPAPKPQRVEPRLDLDKVRSSAIENDGRADGPGRKEPTVRGPGSSSESGKRKSAPHGLRKAWPISIVLLGLVLAAGALWSDSRDDVRARAEAKGRVASAIGALPTTQTLDSESAAFSTRQALQGLYGGYDPHLDGAYWRVSGAPRSWSEWNGRHVFIKPLVSRSDESGTRHVLVTNSVEVRDGLVVREGAGCPACKSLLGAALYERRDNAWVLVTEQRFLRVGGAWGAPPKVDVDFPGRGGVEVRIHNASTDKRRGRKNVQAIVLHAGTPAKAADPAPRDGKGSSTSVAAR